MGLYALDDGRGVEWQTIPGVPGYARFRYTHRNAATPWSEWTETSDPQAMAITHAVDPRAYWPPADPDRDTLEAIGILACGVFIFALAWLALVIL